MGLFVLAQEPEKKDVVVEAQVSAKSFYMGQAFTYSILVDGSNAVKPPIINTIKGFNIKKIEERPLKSKDKPGFIIRYDLIPLESGELVIPETAFDVKGSPVITEAIKINVKRPAEHPGLRLTLSVSQDEVYVGEPFLVTFMWESELPLYTLKAVDVKLPFFNSPTFRTTLPFNSPEGGSKDTIGLPVSDVRTICSHEVQIRDGKRIEILKFQKVVTARYGGSFTLEPTTLLCSFIPPNPKDSQFHKSKKWKPNYPSYFNNNFFEETGNIKHIKYTAKSNSIDIKVKELPVDGKPEDFFGVVGKCTVTASADPVILEAGAPLHLSMKLSGFDFPSVIPMPDLAKLRTFNRNFSIPKQRTSGEYEGTNKIYKQTLRPLRTDVTSIPPVRIPYFDPQTGTYNVAQSKAISLTVKPAGKVTAFDAELSSGLNLKNRLMESPQGIRHNTLTIAAMNSSTTSPFTLVVFVALIPPLFFLIFYIVTYNQRLLTQQPVKARANNALKNFNKGVNQAGSEFRLLERAVRAYFADKLNLTEDAHTCEELLKKISLEDKEQEQLREIYGSFDQARFNSNSSNQDFQSTAVKAKTLIANVDGRI